MAAPKSIPIDKPDISCSPSGPASIPQNAKPFKYFNVAFIGRKGSGRNSLAWRMNNLNDTELPVLPSLNRRVIELETSTRPALQHEGIVRLQVRMVPPDILQWNSFFDNKYGEIKECKVIVFVIDLADEESIDEFYTLYNQVRRHAQDTTPFLIVGNKVDLGPFPHPYRWDARTYLARDYLECSAKSNDRVGEVLDAILKILL